MNKFKQKINTSHDDIVVRLYFCLILVIAIFLLYMAVWAFIENFGLTVVIYACLKLSGFIAFLMSPFWIAYLLKWWAR